jgi:hypothetical protein
MSFANVTMRALLAGALAAWTACIAPVFAQELAPSRADTHASDLGPAHGTSPLIAQIPLFGWFLAEDGELESACGGTLAQDIGAFAGDGEFTRELMSRIQKSAVRISVQPTGDIDDVAKRDLRFRRFDLGSTFTNFSTSKKGICSGTLIAPDLVLTAGHCVSPRYWKDTRRANLPVTTTSQGRRYVTAGELTRLLQIDINYQLQHIASQDPSLPILGVVPLTVQVAELVRHKYNPDSLYDFAILRLKSTAEDISPYALGMSNLEFARPRRPARLAIVQHPSGDTKKIATGSLYSTQSWRLDYADISTAGGSSGAGIYNADGHLVGVHLRGGCNDKGGVNKGMLLGAISRTLQLLAPN